MINFEGLDSLAEIGGVSVDVDHIANAQCTGLKPHGRDRQVATPIRSSREVGFAGGVAAGGTGLTDVGWIAAAALAVGLAFLGDARRTGAFFTGFFLTVLVFLRVAALVTRGFLRVALVLLLAFFLVAITAS